MPESGESVAVCPLCGGRGWIVEADGGAGSAQPCSCTRQDEVPRLLAAAGIPPLYRRCTLESFTTSGATADESAALLEARERCRQYVDGFLQEDGSFTGQGLLFVGAPGVGKTHLAAAVLSELVRRYRIRGRFVDFTSLVHRIQSTFDPGSDASKHEVLDPVIDCDVLVLDELGAQQPTRWVQDTLYLILNTRYTRQAATLFTTNYRLERQAAEPRQTGNRSATGPTDYERGVTAGAPSSRHELLEHRIPPGLVSRLYEMAQKVEIDVGDYRREIKMQRHAG